jgi:hypothetical protein
MNRKQEHSKNDHGFEKVFSYRLSGSAPLLDVASAEFVKAIERLRGMPKNGQALFLSHFNLEQTTRICSKIVLVPLRGHRLIKRSGLRRTSLHRKSTEFTHSQVCLTSHLLLRCRDSSVASKRLIVITCDDLPTGDSVLNVSRARKRAQVRDASFLFLSMWL